MKVPRICAAVGTAFAHCSPGSFSNVRYGEKRVSRASEKAPEETRGGGRGDPNV